MSHPSTEPPKFELRGTNLVLILILIALLAYSGWIAWQKSTIDREIDTLENVSLANISEQIAATSGKSGLSRDIDLATQVLARAKATHVSWSPKLQSVMQLATDGVRFDDISIEPENEVDVQGKATSADAIAKQVASLEQKKLNPFLSSVNFPRKTGELYQFKLNFQLPQ